MLAGQRILRRAEVALPRGGHTTVGPGLPSRPLDSVIAVQGFLEQRIVIALGLEASAHVLTQQDVSMAREEPDGMVGIAEVAILAIGPPID